MQGHIRKRGKHSWAVVVDFGRDPMTGKRRRVWRTVRGTKRDAEAQLVQLLHQRDTGIDVPPGRITVSDYLTKWLDAHARPNTAPKTFRRYEELVRVHLVPVLGSILLTKLRPLHVQEAIAQVRAKGLSEYTVLYCYRVLRQALHHAVKWQLLSRNPADAIESPRPARFEVPLLKPEEVARLLAAADEMTFGTLIHLAS